LNYFVFFATVPSNAQADNVPACFSSKSEVDLKNLIAKTIIPPRQFPQEDGLQRRV